MQLSGQTLLASDIDSVHFNGSLKLNNSLLMMHQRRLEAQAMSLSSHHNLQPTQRINNNESSERNDCSSPVSSCGDEVASVSSPVDSTHSLSSRSHSPTTTFIAHTTHKISSTKICKSLAADNRRASAKPNSKPSNFSVASLLAKENDNNSDEDEDNCQKSENDNRSPSPSNRHKNAQISSSQESTIQMQLSAARRFTVDGLLEPTNKCQSISTPLGSQQSHHLGLSIVRPLIGTDPSGAHPWPPAHHHHHHPSAHLGSFHAWLQSSSPLSPSQSKQIIV